MWVCPLGYLLVILISISLSLEKHCSGTCILLSALVWKSHVFWLTDFIDILSCLKETWSLWKIYQAWSSFISYFPTWSCSSYQAGFGGFRGLRFLVCLEFFVCASVLFCLTGLCFTYLVGWFFFKLPFLPLPFLPFSILKWSFSVTLLHFWA